ncbi:hypothetical protein CEXT_150791 [Caerostris extrusa]|uniref:Uncharacterized protein n=1 Tax=Caerostris extrusa TaxID=172846 RepID=A0AAV4P922_CAEEX|nr:hypothetical protein CEXT_150791 [Caerostris extrusa]
MFPSMAAGESSCFLDPGTAHSFGAKCVVIMEKEIFDAKKKIYDAALRSRRRVVTLENVPAEAPFQQ